MSSSDLNIQLMPMLLLHFVSDASSHAATKQACFVHPDMHASAWQLLDLQLLQSCFSCSPKVITCAAVQSCDDAPEGCSLVVRQGQLCNTLSSPCISYQSDAVCTLWELAAFAIRAFSHMPNSFDEMQGACDLANLCTGVL